MSLPRFYYSQLRASGRAVYTLQPYSIALVPRATEWSRVLSALAEQSLQERLVLFTSHGLQLLGPSRRGPIDTPCIWDPPAEALCVDGTRPEQVRLFFNTFHKSAAAGTFDETFQRCIQHQIVEWTSGAWPLRSISIESCPSDVSAMIRC